MFSQKSKVHIRYLILFLWLSLSFHVYLFYGISMFFQKSPEDLQQPSKNTLRLNNIILETKRETVRLEEDAVISDKDNINSARKFDKNKEEEYNIFNPNLAQDVGQGGMISFVKQNSEQQNKQEESESVRNKDASIVRKKKEVAQSSDGGGLPTPSLFDPDNPPLVNLYNRGTISLASQSKEYADYFLAMQKKVEKYHKEFFPIYQYYQGLIKDGTVIVEFTVDASGKIINADVIQSIGSETADNASLNSILYAKDFGSLPEEFDGMEFIKVRFHFVYTSF